MSQTLRSVGAGAEDTVCSVSNFSVPGGYRILRISRTFAAGLCALLLTLTAAESTRAGERKLSVVCSLFPQYGQVRAGRGRGEQPHLGPVAVGEDQLVRQGQRPQGLHGQAHLGDLDRGVR